MIGIKDQMLPYLKVLICGHKMKPDVASLKEKRRPHNDFSFESPNTQNEMDLVTHRDVVTFLRVRGPINKGPKSKVGGPTICLPLPGPKSGRARGPLALKVTTPLIWVKK